MSTTAIHIALIMALSPITVLLISAVLGMEHIGPLQWLGTALALAGARLIISGGHPETLIELQTASGDGLVVIAMFGWSGYTLLQSRAAPRHPVLARISMFSAAGALFSLPLAIMEMWTMPALVFSTKALSAYVFAGIVPGLLAYAGFAWLGGKFGSVRTSLVLNIGADCERSVVVRDPRRAAEADPFPRGPAYPGRCLGELAPLEHVVF
ncbi:DMT family transporter [Bradyrhizobium sp. AS23.2]|uniref:DMT family transporter n=1 Tax=Bradyrhizobium sp. AS23.2 TaxID=1680155 RepID=UPI000939FA50|nr:DMT family transporter [Bradyrhizobium sp. AS23.2]